MNASAWFYSQPGFHGEFSTTTNTPPAPKVGDTTVTEYWDGEKWCERRLVWDGRRFAEQA